MLQKKYAYQLKVARRKKLISIYLKNESQNKAKNTGFGWVGDFFLITPARAYLTQRIGYRLVSNPAYSYARYELAKRRYEVSNLFRQKTIQPVEDSEDSSNKDLLNVRVHNKYGYANHRHEIIIPAIFDTAAKFSKNYALVKLGGKYGIIDRQGEAKTPFIYKTEDFVVNSELGYIFETRNNLTGVSDLTGNALIPPELDRIEFSLTRPKSLQTSAESREELVTHAVVTKKGKQGIVDLKGNVNVAIKYDAIDPSLFYRGYLLATKDNRQGIIDFQDNNIVPFKYDEINYINDIDKSYIIASKNNRKGIADLKGNNVIPFKYDNIDPSIIAEGSAVDTENGKYGIIDLEGNILIPFKYDGLNPSVIKRGYAIATKIDKEGIIDINNKTIIPFKYDRLGTEIVERGYDIARKNGKDGVLGINNKEIIPFEFANLDPDLIEREHIILTKGKSQGVMDIRGNILIPFAYDRVEELISSRSTNEISWLDANDPQYKVYLVTKNKRQGVVDAQGKTIIPLIYDKIESSFPYKNSYLVTKSKQQGVLNFKGQTIIPLIDGKIEDFNDFNTEGYGIVTRNNKQGVVDLKGRTLIPFQYDKIEYVNLDRGYVIATNRSLQGAVDLEGKILLPLEYSDVSTKTYYLDSLFIDSSDFLLATKGQLTYLFNLQQKSVVLSELEEINFYLNSQNYAQITKNGKQGIADIEGNTIVPVEYDNVRIPRKLGYHGIFTARDGKKGVVDFDYGNQIVPIEYDSIDYFNLKEADAIVSKGKQSGIYEASRDRFTPLSYDEIELLSDDEYYLAINKVGADLTKIKDSISLLKKGNKTSLLLKDFYPTEIRYAIVTKNNKQGVLDIIDDKIVIPLEYDEILGNLESEYAIASKQDRNGILNLKNNVFTVIKSDKLNGTLLDRGYIIFTSKGKEGIADLSGEIIIPAKYEIIRDSTLGTIEIKLINDTYLIAAKNNKSGLLNIQTKKFLALDYDLILNYRHRLNLEPDLLIAIEDEKQGIINLQGNLIVPLEENKIIRYHNGVVLREKGDRFDRQIVLSNRNKTANTVLENRDLASDNLFLLTVEGKYSTFSCVIDRQGELLLKSQHHNWGAREKIDNLCRSLVGIKVDNTVIRENPRPMELGAYDYFRSSLMLVKVNDKWGLVNKKGDFVFYPRFDSLGEFSEGMAIVKQNGKYGYINTRKIAIAPQFDFAEDFSGGFAKVIKNNKINFIDRNGKTILNAENYPEVSLELMSED